MKKYVESMVELISGQIVPGKTNLIKIEGIEYPQVYQAIYQSLKKRYASDMHTALACEKYEQFLHSKASETNTVLQWFESEHLVLKDGTLTGMRNQAANENADKTSIYLLLGAEAVQDRGGLEDFSSITTADLAHEVSDDFSKWFKPCFDLNGFDEAYLKTIDKIYRDLFAVVQLDVMRLSCFVDELEDMSFDTPKDILGTIYATLDRYWGVPRIEGGLKLDVQAKDDIALLDSAMSFIRRKEDIVKKIQDKKLDDKLQKYIQNHDVDPNLPFPQGSHCFATFWDFANALKDYGAGKNQSELKNKFIAFDYSIIAEILGVKITDTKTKNSKITLHGDPMEAYCRMILDVVDRYRKLKRSYPGLIEISVEEIRLSQCTSSESGDGSNSVISAYTEVLSMLGGLVDYLNKAHLGGDEDPLELYYVDGTDPFTLAAYNDMFSALCKPTRNWDDMCYVDFTVASDDDAVKCKYHWVFSPKAPWKKSFSLLTGTQDDSLVPALLTSKHLESCIACEDDDEFGVQLENCNPKNETEGQQKQIRKYFSEYGINDKFNLLYSYFGEWAAAIREYGFYNCLEQLSRVVSAYSDMIHAAYCAYPRMTQEARDKLYLIADSFCILDAKAILSSAALRAAVVPAYHPLTLEKIAARGNFLREGLKGLYLNLEKGYSNKKTIDGLFGMAAVAGSLDALISTSQQYLSCRSMHGYHAVYLPKEPEMLILNSSNTIDSIVSAEEDDDKSVPANAEILYRNIMDYLHTFPARMDGLTISFINPYDMHHILSAMQVIDKKLQDEGVQAVINLNIICIDAQKNSFGYLKRWLDDFFSEEKHIRVNTYLRYGFFENNGTVSKLGEMLDGTDICFIYDLMEMKSIRFKKMAGHSEVSDDMVQFPMVRIPDVIPQTAGQQRSISTSQFQFRNSKIYTQLVHVMGYPYDEIGEYRTMFALEMPERMRMILDEAHLCSKWTVCIDQTIDRELIQSDESKIIGFSTGDGDFGDLNVTVSTQASILSDIQTLLERKLFERFPSWNAERRSAAARFCLDATKDMDGIRVLKALNPNDYSIHSYLAYILTMQILRAEDTSSIQRIIVNLDAYTHWFDKTNIGSISESESRPDLLLLDIPKLDDVADPDKPLHIRACVIECKMGKESVSQLDNAKTQVVHGCEVLKNNWNPDSTNVMRRHWYNQLYRVLVFSKINVRDNQAEYAAVEQKLQNILEGKFDIEWRNAVYAYWLDRDSDKLDVYSDEQDGVSVEMNVAGQLYIQKMLMPAERRNEAVRFETQTEDEAQEDTEDVTTEDWPEDPLPVDIDIQEPLENNPTEPTDTENNPIAPDIAPDEPSEEKTAASDPNEAVAPVVNEGRDLSAVRMRLGEDIYTHTSFYWEFGHKELNNRHLLINGNSGCGKTYAIQTLLMEQARQGISAVVFDYTAGFTMTKLDPAFKAALGDKIKQRIVRTQKLPVNPFQKHDIKLDEDLYVPEENTDIATKIANIFQKVYDFGDQQKSEIYSAIMEGLSKYGDQMSFAHMAKLLAQTGGPTAERVLSKIRPFIDLDPFTLDEPFDWGDVRGSNGIVYVIQLTGYSSDVKLLLTEILLWDIWSYCEKNGDESKPFTVVLDEAQNLDHSAASPSAKILTEGRKFGLSGWYATQFMKPQLSDDEIQRLQQAGQKLYFCPPDEGVMTVARNIDITAQGSKDWAEKLKRLKKGECVTCGGMVRNGKWSKYEPRIIKITSFQERLK